MVMYLVCLVDRNNVAFANLRMSADLGFADRVYGFGVGMFFVGYALFEVPGAIIVERWSVRKWLAAHPDQLGTDYHSQRLYSNRGAVLMSLGCWWEFPRPALVLASSRFIDNYPSASYNLALEFRARRINSMKKHRKEGEADEKYHVRTFRRDGISWKGIGGKAGRARPTVSCGRTLRRTLATGF